MVVSSEQVKDTAWFSTLIALTRTDKPYGTMLLLWPCLWALLFAGAGRPSLRNICIFTVGCMVMRACGCVVNDIADQDFDKKVARTSSRPLARGALTTRQALGVFFALSAIAAGLACALSFWTKALAVVGFFLACVYPLAKRITVMPQLVLGVAFSWGVPMAFMEQQGVVDGRAWLLFMAVVAWTVAYDTVYALQDREDDRKIGIGSSAVFFGQYVHLAVAILYMVFFMMMGYVGVLFQQSWPYFMAWTGSGFVLAWQVLEARKETGPAYFRAFRANQWIGLLLCLGIVM